MESDGRWKELDEVLRLMTDEAVAGALAKQLKEHAHSLDATTQAAIRSAITRLNRSRGGPTS